LVLVFEGIRRKFLKYLQLSQMSPRTRRIVERLGMIGTAARGAVFALAGVLVIEAAVTYQPSKAGGLDKALLTLRNQPFGEFLLILGARPDHLRRLRFVRSAMAEGLAGPPGSPLEAGARRVGELPGKAR
jgi:Domain of Unknown Function (DUF1206)